MRKPRVRFAPSPTGYLHIGGARTALFNYLYAQKHGGTLILRIEDTDRERSTEEMTGAILAALDWLGLRVDEGPYYQADGIERHRSAAEHLLERGAAYRCFCTPEDLRTRRDQARRMGEGFGYDGRCRRLSRTESEEMADRGEPYALRFAVPEGSTEWEDLVHGFMSFRNDDIDDFVILRSDGTPVYNLAVVSDDIEMRISLVMRGDDHISNTPKQLLIYGALAVEPPRFAHLPMILGSDGKRLSKRHGALAVEAYREQGLLPEAMVNFLALLGWSPGDDREVMDHVELIEAFSLERILKKSALFDPEKILWLNGQHIRRENVEELAPMVEVELRKGNDRELEAGLTDGVRFLSVIDMVRERARTIPELAERVAPFFTRKVCYEEQAVRRFWKDPAGATEVLRNLRELLVEIESFETATLEREIRALSERMGLGAGKLIHPLRVALLGVAVSPGIFEVLKLMGRARTLERIDQALDDLDGRTTMET